MNRAIKLRGKADGLERMEGSGTGARFMLF